MAAITTAIILLRTAPTDTTTITRMRARRTDITAQIGFITASSWALVPGTDGAGAAAADTGATIGAIAADTDIMADIAVDMGIAADTATTEDMLAVVMATTVVADITAVAGPTQAVDSTVVAAGSTAVVAAASTVVEEDMVVADTDNPRLI